MIFPENFEEKIGFDQIRIWLKELCLSDLGKNGVDEIQFMTDPEIIEQILLKVHEFKQICMFEDNFPIDNYHDLRDSLKKTKVEGTYMDEREIFNLGRSLETIKQIINFFKTYKEKYPSLFKMCGEVAVYPYIIDKVNTILTNQAKIKDNASPGLKEVRAAIKSKEGEASRKIHQIFKKAQSSGWTDEDAGVAIRDGRPVIPVSASNKRMIKGYIHDESSTGKTVYIEPVEVIELNNEIRELGYAEKREIIKILIDFTSDIRPYREDLFYSFDFLKKIDLIRAKALFAIKIPSNKPILNNHPFIQWNDAFHPVLFVSHKSEKKEVVPLSIKLDNNQRILLISGPNAGGKSVCLKTVGLVQYMIQCGILASMKEDSEVGVFEHIFIDIGDEQSIENDLSTYSSHLMNMKYFLKNSDEKTLLLVDEFGTGTEPNIGGALAEAMLQKFNENKALGVITTHYANLKHFAASTMGIVNGAMLYDTQKMKPLFKLDIGGPGSSFAFEIARSIGIPEDVLDIASQKTGGKQVEFDKHLREILRDKRYWEKKRMNIRRVEKQLEEKLEKHSAEIENINKSKKEILQKSKQEAENIIFELNKKIENTIRTIKESNADKEKTREARKELEGFTRDIQKKLKTDGKDPVSGRKLPDLKKSEKREVQDIEVGSKVKMKGQNLPGEVMDINKDSIMVAFGNMVTTIQKNRLEPISENEYKKQTKKSDSGISGISDVFSKKLNFKSDIDLRGKRAEDALLELNAFLDDALMVNASHLRILHGKGNGILKQVIRECLRKQDFVKSVKDEHVERGGAGITLVELKE